MEGIILAIFIIIGVLEVLRFFRTSAKLFENIDEIKERVTNIDELLKEQNK